MKGFIVVTNELDNKRVCLPLTIIKAVCEYSKGCFVETHFDVNNGSTGLDVIESFDKVMSAIKQAL